MQEMIIIIMEKFGYLGIFLLILLENIFPPIPSEVILLFGGFMTTRSNLSLIGVVIFSTLGSIIGAIVLYFIGKILNKERLIKLVNSKLGKVLRLSLDDILKADDWFSRKGYKTVFYCRFVPVLRSLISVPAGMNEMPLVRFLILTSLGSLIWNIVLTYLGTVLGDNWEKVLIIFDTYSKIVIFILIIVFVLGILYFYIRKKKK